MKWIAITLLTLTAILAILYLILGGYVLALALGTLALTVLIVAIFSLGIWYAHKSIQLGATLAIQAQAHNDRWDTAKTQALSRFGGDLLKLTKAQQPASWPPLLQAGNDSIDASFTIHGLGEGEQ